jgi:hypothetical protein
LWQDDIANAAINVAGIMICFIFVVLMVIFYGAKIVNFFRKSKSCDLAFKLCAAGLVSGCCKGGF